LDTVEKGVEPQAQEEDIHICRTSAAGGCTWSVKEIMLNSR